MMLDLQSIGNDLIISIVGITVSSLIVYVFRLKIILMYVLFLVFLLALYYTDIGKNIKSRLSVFTPKNSELQEKQVINKQLSKWINTPYAIPLLLMDCRTKIKNEFKPKITLDDKNIMIMLTIGIMPEIKNISDKNFLKCILGIVMKEDPGNWMSNKTSNKIR